MMVFDMGLLGGFMPVLGFVLIGHWAIFWVELIWLFAVVCGH